jgi:hypothetical protein
MKTTLDEALFRLLDAHPDWISRLAPADADLLLRRRQGASLRALGALSGLTPAGVRARLYGQGCGRLVRSGGVLGKLRGLAMQERRAKAR